MSFAVSLKSPSRMRTTPLETRIVFRAEYSEKSEEISKEITSALGISPLLARILVGRGITSAAAARQFLSPTFRDDLPDPSRIKNITAGARLLLQAVKSGELITVYSDFDVDGLSGASQLVLFLLALGGNVNHYAPSRFHEGYGLAKSAVEKLVKAGTQLLVTVDCGITNHKELAFAKQTGLKTMVIDHHETYELPPADVIINPTQEGCEFGPYKLAAAGLVWMLLIVLRKEAGQILALTAETTLPDPKEFLDFAALGTICDMVPLRDLNRLIAQRGLEALQQTTRLGLIALKEVSGISPSKKLNAGHIGFALGPRINAAGRLGDAKDVFELLVTKNSKRAKVLAESINRLNQQRRAIEEEVLLQCLEHLKLNRELVDKAAFAIYGNEFHLGVIGIVAQRLMDQFYKPVAIMAPAEEVIGGELKPVVKGSIRGVSGFHVADALQALEALLVKHGGHAQAGGFTVLAENRELFETQFIALAEDRLPPESRARELVVDTEISFSELDFQMVSELTRLAPFGIGNPSPLFVTRNVTIDSIHALANNHLRVRFSDGKNYLPAVAWRFQGHPLLVKGAVRSIAYQPTINTYQGVSSVQLELREIWE